MTIRDIQNQIKASSVRDVVLAALERAEADTTNAILEVMRERALMRADDLDAARARGDKLGELAGVPFIAKDNMLTFGGHTTAASKMLENFQAPFQAEAIERLEAAGAICIAKANLDAFAHGGSTENSAFGPTANPHDSARVAGGSSGGSAAVVALDIVPFALGTDTGGSIRQPASFCGVVGMKPTYGAVSRYGVVAMASSTDVIGTLSANTEDAELVMRTIAGRDTKDSTTITSPYETAVGHGKKVGVIKQWLDEGVEDDVRSATLAMIEKLRSGGYEVEEVSLPSLEHALAVYYIIVPAEIASNLARYDGVRYGVRSDAADSLDQVYSLSRSAGFMQENKRRIMIGNYVLSSGYYDAYFQKAAKVRTLMVRDFEAAFDKYDFLVGPTVPTVAFGMGQNTHNPLSMYLADQMTVSASLAGLPAISVPAPTTGLPVGFQIIGPAQADLAVLGIAKELEASA